MSKFISLFLIFSNYSFGKSVTKRNIDDLTLRLEQLEARVSSLEEKSSTPTSLKVKDFKNKAIDTARGRSSASTGEEASMSETQRNEVLKQIEILKSSQKERNELLNTLLDE